ncbi:MAG: PHP domain-containing protein [Clostridia bacterium]|nr:PHP domain-containing protein [Clostridia bacterium]
MYQEFLPENGNFYKVNMHCHTNLSDGKQTPEEVKEHYKSLGYSAVCFTDHEVLLGHQDLCDKDFIALHGYEVAIKQDQSGHTAEFMPVYHFNMIAKDQSNLTIPRFYRYNSSFPGNSAKWAETQKFSSTIDTYFYNVNWLNWYLNEVKNGGFLINYNHPEWSLQTVSDYIDLEHLHSIEVINGGCRRLNDNTALHYQNLLRAGKKLVPTGGDDNHSQKECGRSWTIIKAPELSYEALIAAYERGDCYASEGPEILSLVLDGDTIRVKTSPAATVTLLSEGRHTQQAYNCTCAEFSYRPKKFGRYFRIEVRDAAGNKAFSNAYKP